MPGWDRFDVPGWFRDSFDVPVLVDNDVNIMALGERELAWPDVDHLVFVKVATGIGSGVISGGYLQRGAQGTAGDIGHVYVARGADVPCQCGNRGCLEALASGPALGRALRRSSCDAETSQDVVELVKRGNIDAIQAVRQAGRDIGEVLTTCVRLINPSRHRHRRIARPGRRAPHRRRARGRLHALDAARDRAPADHPVQGGPDAAVLGASMLAIHHALSPVNIEAMVVGVSGSLSPSN